MATAVLSSATPILSLLDEDQDELKVHALNKLNVLVDEFWAEIASDIAKIETLYEDENFKDRSLAAFVASKVFYHLEEFDDALKYALGAGSLFDVAIKSEYVETLMAKCIDEYVKQRKEAEKEDSATVIDERLEAIVSSMFERSFEAREYKQALGIALESRRLDLLERAVMAGGDVASMLQYLFQLSQTVVQSKVFRLKVLELLMRLYQKLETPDYLNMCQCLLFLEKPSEVANVLNTILLKQGSDVLLAYQAAFDLWENQNQAFMNQVSAELPTPEAEEDNKEDVEKYKGATEALKTLLKEKRKQERLEALTKKQEEAKAKAEKEKAEKEKSGKKTKAERKADEVQKQKEKEEEEKKEKEKTARPDLLLDEDVYAGVPDTYAVRMMKLKDILSGRTPTNLYLNFLYGKNQTDLNLLNGIKEKLSPRNSITHNACVIAHGFTQVGTTVDVFLRNNLQWLGKATNWAKFTATASIGVIHRGHHDESLKLLEPYLPVPGQQASPYQEGGALYALGLIHANQGGDKSAYLLEALQNSGGNEVVQHGACLGLGLNAMATHDAKVYEEIKGVCFSESAVAGEAAGLAMGLVYLGKGTGDFLEELLSYAHDTEHEKTIRGLVLGIAVMVYGCEESAEPLIEQLLRDKDPLLRYGGMWSISMAYCATANNQAIRRLLHVAASDVDSNVRRAAVIGLGYVLCNEPEQVPKLVSLLADSFNPMVRYGSCMAVGLACAGSGSQAAIRLLSPLLTDSVDFVRQASFIALSMVLIQHNATKEPYVKEFREKIQSVFLRKGDTMTQVGALFASGILDAGGRNVTISLLSPAGHKRMAAIVGTMVFFNFWYWYPEAHFLSLAFTSTATMGLNNNLQMPDAFSFVSHAKPSTFAYPPAIELKKAEERKAIVHATLSTTLKAKAKAKAKAKKEDGKEGAVAMDVDGEKEAAEKSKETKEEAAKESKTAEELEAEKKAKEPLFEILRNPARVTTAQRAFVKFDPKNQRYIPVKASLSGIVMLRDKTPGAPEKIVVTKAPTVGVPGISEDEPDPPEPFQFTRF
eukprot:gb/GEZN01001035.1/.p1 GENE.gb/GEZN01001035.1/~~gb/GEZN01001035.1/.p1  ORF type:complete len:1045 (-),score=225.72 gb/GEZN01001035.1/:204-3338(-)